MENPHNGRATIENNFDNLKIIIPAKRQWIVLVFLFFWLCGWFVGETTVLFLHHQNMVQNWGAKDFFLLFWLCFWTLGGLFVVQVLLWQLIGKQIITFDRHQMQIENKGKILDKNKIYDLAGCKNFRVTQQLIKGRKGRIHHSWPIQFDYGMKTFSFGEDLDEPENRNILKILKDGKWIKD